MSEITLTQSQLTQIRNDMDKKVDMLNDAEINALATKVNSVINLPFLNEEKELMVFGKVVRWVDKQLYQLLPNEYYVLIKDSSDGISKEEAVKIEDRLTPLINNVINIPVLTEAMEAKLIRLILGLIITAMVKGFKLEQVDPQS